jgi:hypothetical protein
MGEADVSGRLAPSRAEHLRWLASVGDARLDSRGRVVAAVGHDSAGTPRLRAVTWLWLLTHGLAAGGDGRLRVTPAGHALLARGESALAQPLTAATLHLALREAGGGVREAARRLGISAAHCCQCAQRHELVRNPPGGPRRHDVCWLEAPDDGRLPADEFAALWADVGTNQLAEMLDVSPAAVSRRALRLHLRERRA